MRFDNREEAALLLADRLDKQRGERPVVLGIPRGGAPMADVIAQSLGGDLDVVLVHKLRAPFQPELAVGSIDELGHVFLTPAAADLAIDGRALESEKRTQRAVLEARRRRYRAVKASVDLAGRSVILVDDGLATGATAMAAVRSVRARRAARVVVAVAVAAPETVARLRREADEVECLYEPEEFNAVGEFFTDFSEVTDAEVVRLLARAGTHLTRPWRPAVKPPGATVLR